MRRFFKFLGVFLLLIIVGLVAAPFLFRKQIIRLAKAEANKNLNADLYFDDNISVNIWRSFPKLSVGFDNVAIVKKSPFLGDTLISIKDLDFTVNVESLIGGGKIELHTLRLTDPHVRLLVKADGTSNWDIALKDTTPVQSTKVEDSSSNNFELDLQEFAITGGQLLYSDTPGKTHASIIGLDHLLKGDLSATKYDLSTNTKIESLSLGYGGVDYLKNVKTLIEGGIRVDTDKGEYTLLENHISMNDLKLKLQGAMSITEKTLMDIKFKAETLSFKSLLSLVPALYTKDFSGLQANGNVGFDGFVKGEYTETSLPAYALNILIKDGNFKYPDLPIPLEAVNADIKVSAPQGPMEGAFVNINQFKMNLAGESLSAKGTIADPMGDPLLDMALLGKVQLDKLGGLVKLDPGTKMGGLVAFDVKGKGRSSALEQGKIEGFTTLGFITANNVSYIGPDLPEGMNVSTGRLDFTNTEVIVKGVNAMLGKSDLSMDGTVQNAIGYAMVGGPLTGTLNLRSNYLDLRPYTSSSTSTANTTTTASTSPSTSPASDYAIPKELNLKLDAAIQKVMYDTYELDDVKGRLLLEGGKLDFNGLGFNLFKGRLALDGYYDTRNALAPEVDAKLRLIKLDIPIVYKFVNTVQKLAPLAQYLEGLLDASIDIHAVLGNDLSPNLNTLTSSGNLQINKAIVNNLPALQSLGDKLGLQNLKKVVLSGINPSYTLTNGRFTFTKPLNFLAGNTAIEAIGSTGLDRTIDYDLVVTVPASQLQSQANGILNNLLKTQNVNIPGDGKVKVKVKVGGTIDKPTISLDFKDAALAGVDALKQRALDELNKAKALAEERARAEADRLKSQANTERARIENDARNKANAEKSRLDAQRRAAEDEAQRKADIEKKRLEDEAKNRLKGVLRK